MLGGAPDNQIDLSCSSDSVGSVSIPNGVVCYAGTTGESLATYQCDERYRLTGNTQRMCQSDGHWDGTIPICIMNNDRK